MPLRLAMHQRENICKVMIQILSLNRTLNINVLILIILHRLVILMSPIWLNKLCLASKLVLKDKEERIRTLLFFLISTLNFKVKTQDKSTNIQARLKYLAIESLLLTLWIQLVPKRETLGKVPKLKAGRAAREIWMCSKHCKHLTTNIIGGRVATIINRLLRNKRPSTAT